MNPVRCLLLCALVASFAAAQTPLFAELDASLPVQAASADASGDLDNDGDQDMVGVGFAFLNDGHGRFTTIPVPSLGFPRVRTVLSDLDLVAPGPRLLMNTTRQIAHGSIPRPGRPASIDLYGTPGGAWFLWVSNGTTSLPFPPWGTVLIDPASAQPGAMGTFLPPTTTLPGTATFGATLPNNPALVGWTTFWQAIDAAQMRFTNRITITVQSY